MTLPTFTVWRLIAMYRAHFGEYARREDGRHDRWWIEELGVLPASELTTARILRTVQQLEADERSESTVAFYLRFLRSVDPPPAHF